MEQLEPEIDEAHSKIVTLEEDNRSTNLIFYGIPAEQNKDNKKLVVSLRPDRPWYY